MPPRVYLTGFMASGKSTVGPLLADALGYRFADLDWRISDVAGRSVADLFAEGEAAFRAAESRALMATTGETDLVIATGGGALADPANLAVARAAGAVVWLRASVATTLARLGDASDRPMLHDGTGQALTGAALATRVRDLMAVREPFYAQADAAVDADGPAEAVARHVAEALARRR